MTTLLKDAVQDVQLWVRRQPRSWRDDSYRSAALKPVQIDDEYKRIFGASTFSIVEATSIFSDVIAKRKSFVREAIMNCEQPARPAGRFLKHNFQETTYSCTPQEATKGFFDSLDMPSWDFWVGLGTTDGQHFLYSWIPSELIELVDQGIQCSAEENILWVEEVAML